MLLPTQNSVLAIVIALSGLIGHVIFNRLEPRGFSRILCLLIGPPTVIACVFRGLFNSTLFALLISHTVYIAILICSVAVYRISPFHPLAAFPGPIACKVTRFWAWYIFKTGNQHRYYRSLHLRYGTHVRTGPNHLHICDADAIPIVLGTRGLLRGARYDVTKPPGAMGSLFSLVNTQEHAQRRRIWDRGMNTTAVQGYEDALTRRITQLISILEKLQGEIDLSIWLSWFSFDFMGDLAFGGAFRLMEQGYDADGYIRLSRLGIMHQEMVGTIPWVNPIHHLLPGAKYIRSLRDFGKQSVLARIARGSSRKDIFYHLLDEEGVGSGPLALPELIMEATLAIVAGSDTTGTTLSNIFFYLISNPDTYARLQAEVDGAFPPGSDAFDPAVLSRMPFLNAVINETLRLQPAVPNGAQRVFPSMSGGAVIAGRWVPGSTTVQVSNYSVHRDPRYFFPEPDSFLPERWVGQQQAESKLNQAAFFPFSHGPMICVGKNLAIMELRMVTSSLLQKFDFAFAKGWDSEDWERSLSDGFLLTKGKMPILLTARK